jgi:predicted ABC-type ATPase
MGFHWLHERPIVVAIAGPNGAGKTTFYKAHIRPAGLPFVNADVLSRALSLDPNVAARIAGVVRRNLVHEGVSFAFETVFSDPVGDRLQFLKDSAAAGYTVVLCYIGLASAALSSQRVSMRVSQGGHGVPADKLRSRYPRILANLKQAIPQLPHVLVYDNSDLTQPMRHVAAFDGGQMTFAAQSIPRWLTRLI